MKRGRVFQQGLDHGFAHVRQAEVLFHPCPRRCAKGAPPFRIVQQSAQSLDVTLGLIRNIARSLDKDAAFRRDQLTLPADIGPDDG